MTETAPTNTPDTTFLYRIENPDIPQRGQSDVSHPDIVGQWFTPDPRWATTFARKANARPGGQIVVAEVPTADLDSYHASNHPVASTMDHEGDAGENYIVPRDSSLPTTTLSLEDVLGELSGSRLSGVEAFNEAQSRILQHLGHAGLLHEVQAVAAPAQS